MSASSPSLSPPAEAVMAAIAHLSREDKVVVASLLHREVESDDFPDWEMRIVHDRLDQLDEGKTKAIPLEEALASLDIKWARKS
ncbi:putative addiction module component [Prosthecobacter fusiformis]|uniref:Putative addiction module component n=1 Tax=Prosthecobacter fusiformis TaxID=48464 RepID=A0A4R7RPA3_9BACT|nr:addiction module protein [Prosthecobacter fusiformis]TDU67291.1 putative addiction module component [Prosthecobacter fusiformis]